MFYSFDFWRLFMYLTALLMAILELTEARVGFVKDQSTTRIKFPPLIQKLPHGIPTGHLRPFGWHRAPDAPVPEESGMLSPHDFFMKYVKDSKPVVFKGAIKDVPAMENWKRDDYLKKTYGHVQVHAMVKKELMQKGIKKMTMKQFLKQYNFEDWYLSNIIPQEMMHELILPSCLKCDFLRSLQEAEIWMSSGGTVSMLHSHADHNLHCLLAGRKDFILIDPKHKKSTYYIAKKPHKGAGYCDLGDLDKLNMYKYGSLSDVPWVWNTLQPGDCIFVPATYLHQVRSYGRSFSFTILWAQIPDTDFSDCSEGELSKVLTLDKAPFIWTYLHADRELANMNLDAKAVRQHLLVWMRNETGLRYDVFKDYYDEIMSEIPKEERLDCKIAWQSVTGGNPKVQQVPRDKIQDLPDGSMSYLASVLNRAHEYHGHKPNRPHHDEL